MKPNSRKPKPLAPIDQRPVEWDFRWAGSEAEAEHVLALELAREALRQADMRLTTSREKTALHRLVMAMTARGAIAADPELLSLVYGLKRSAFVAGVISAFVRPSELGEVELPTAFKLRHRIRSISDQKLSPGAQLHITLLSKGKHFTPWPATSDKFFVFRLHQGMTAERAKEQFAEWADANLPAGPKRKGGRPSCRAGASSVWPSSASLRLVSNLDHMLPSQFQSVSMQAREWRRSSPSSGIACMLRS